MACPDLIFDPLKASLGLCRVFSRSDTVSHLTSKRLEIRFDQRDIGRVAGVDQLFRELDSRCNLQLTSQPEGMVSKAHLVSGDAILSGNIEHVDFARVLEGTSHYLKLLADGLLVDAVYPTRVLLLECCQRGFLKNPCRLGMETIPRHGQVDFLIPLLSLLLPVGLGKHTLGSYSLGRNQPGRDADKVDATLPSGDVATRGLGRHRRLLPIRLVARRKNRSCG